MGATGLVFWFFGRSGAGKTTLSTLAWARLVEEGVKAVRLDGDDLRRGLCAGLGFGVEARNENHRRAAEVAALMARQGAVVLVATMAPAAEQREIVRRVVGDDLRWIYVDAGLEACSSRDPKGLYEKGILTRADGGEIFEFEVPAPGQVHLRASTEQVEERASFGTVLEYIQGELKNRREADRNLP
jgi:adenylylsulfate kinase-like enzyme